MVPTTIHLPNGQEITVSPVFAGLSFKFNDLNIHQSVFPPGWTIILESEDEYPHDEPPPSGRHVHPYRKPTLCNDKLFISSISNPSSSDFIPPTSPTRAIAMMLWATLSWYFHQPAPSLQLDVNESLGAPKEGRPKGEWRVNIKKDGIFKGRHLLPKLERMGLISSMESSVGLAINDRGRNTFTDMFVSQRSFWQLDPRIFLFTLSPTSHSPYPGGSSPYPSRPNSPSREMTPLTPTTDIHGQATQDLWSPQTQGPFTSASHLPTYYPPPPPQYTFTNSIRHPIRPKPPGQGETFYTRYIPSIEQYLSFRTASISPKPITHRGPVSSTSPKPQPPRPVKSLSGIVHSLTSLDHHTSDMDLLHSWMNNPRVSDAWGVQGPREVQDSFLTKGLTDRHSFPVIGCWDGKPFGYFEIYWVKEDPLGRHLSTKDFGDWDRGIHALVGEQEFRGPHRVKVWISALVHYCFLADPRTEKLFVEPRVDNNKFISYLQEAGFCKEREITFPHKQAALMKLVREAWNAPAT